MPEQASDEYEIVPRTQLEHLQHEVEKIRKNPFGDTTSSKDLLSSLDKLNANIVRMVSVFETANDEIVRDYKDNANTERLNKVLEQNEKLAKGIVAIAELLKEVKDRPLRPPEPASQPAPQQPLSDSEAAMRIPAMPDPYQPRGQAPRSEAARQQVDTAQDLRPLPEHRVGRQPVMVGAQTWQPPEQQYGRQQYGQQQYGQQQDGQRPGMLVDSAPQPLEPADAPPPPPR